MCDHSLFRIRSHLLKKSLMENFIFCAVSTGVVTSLPENDVSDFFSKFLTMRLSILWNMFLKENESLTHKKVLQKNSFFQICDITSNSDF